VVTFAKANNIKPLDFPYTDAQRIYRESVKDANVPTDLPMSEEEFRSTLDPVAIINNRATIGGPQPTELTRMVDMAKQKVQLQEEWIAERKLKITTSLARLDADFAALTPE
jgi:argininosuccinate lyase